MPVAKRIKPLDLFTKEEWQHVSRRSDLVGIGLVLHAWSVIGLVMAAAIWQPWLIVLAVPIIGARQLGLAVLMHEAAHGGLSSNAKLNHVLGQWFAGAPTGGSLKSYRPYHLQHHKYAQQPEDPDLGLSAPFPISKPSLRRKIIRDLTGQTFWKQRKNQILNAFGVGIRNTEKAQNRLTAAREAAFPFLISNLLLLIGLSLLGYWWAYFVLWLLPMATWNQMITRLRNIAEHAVVPDNEDPMKHARTTRATFIERVFLAPYWVNYHCEHHMFMHLPCYRLAEAHRLLERKGHTENMEVQTGYLSVLNHATSKPEMESVPA
ncbi:MAG: fatty acid desaturase family protein [Pseudomonadota bacterium]